MNTEKKQLVEMGKLLENDINGKYRTSLRDRIIELRRTTEQKVRKELDREQLLRLEAMQRALIISERILEKVFVVQPHEMNSSSRMMS